MLTQEPVKIPDDPGKISFSTINDTEYVRYLVSRKYNPEKKYTESKRVFIGKRLESMPGLMYPNDNYEKYFTEKGGEDPLDETMTPEERDFTEKNRTYSRYIPFFDALYYEFKQQTRKRPDDRLTRCKAQCLNRVLEPLKEMLEDEDYAILLRPIISDEDDMENGMDNSDAMMILTQYKSALEKYHSSHR